MGVTYTREQMGHLVRIYDPKDLVDH
jgi:hypothetical protein